VGGSSNAPAGIVSGEHRGNPVPDHLVDYRVGLVRGSDFVDKQEQSVVIADFRLPIANLVFGFWPEDFETLSVKELEQRPKTKAKLAIGNRQ